MTAILAALSAAGLLKWIGLGVGALLTLGATWLHGRSSGKVDATNAARVQIDAAVTKSTIAGQQAVEAKADTEQANKTIAAMKVAADAKDTAQAIPDADLDAAGANLGILRSD